MARLLLARQADALAPAGMTRHPDWLALPSDLWVRVLASTRSDHAAHHRTRDIFASPCHQGRVAHLRLVATAAATCRQLRALVQSVQADELFGELDVWSGSDGLQEHALPGWRRYLQQHAHRARIAFIHGGMNAAHLQLLVVKATALTTLELCNQGEADEDAALSSALAISECPLTKVYLRNSAAAPRLPTTVIDVQSGAAQLNSLAHLCRLRRLCIFCSWWSTASSDQLIRFFPQLKVLHLSLDLGPQSDLAPLRMLSCQGCQMHTLPTGGVFGL